MIRQVAGLHRPTLDEAPLPPGQYLVEIRGASYRANSRPFLALALRVLQPSDFAGHEVSGRISCTPKQVWKLGWFLRDFGYDADLLDRDQLDDRKLRGLRGMVRLSRAAGANAVSVLDSFAPAHLWEVPVRYAPATPSQPEVEP